jgi:GTPase SAR1 family protein
LNLSDLFLTVVFRSPSPLLQIVIDNKKLFNDAKVVINEDWKKDVILRCSLEGENFVLNVTLLTVSSRAYLEKESFFDLQLFVGEMSNRIICSETTKLNGRYDDSAQFKFIWRASQETSPYQIIFCGCKITGMCVPASASRPQRQPQPTAVESTNNPFSIIISKLGEISKGVKGDGISSQPTLHGKILILGTGLSGKSVIARQIQKYLSEVEKEQVLPVVELIHSNILGAVKDLLKSNSNLCLLEGRIFELSPRTKKSKIIIERYGMDTSLSPEIGEHIITLWGDPAMKVTFERAPPEFFSSDAIAFYLENIPRITSPEYIPTEEDILHVYSRTSAILRQTFLHENIAVSVVDIGGQTVCRKKWTGLINGQILIDSGNDCDEKSSQEREPKLSGLIYVVSVGEYDQAQQRSSDNERFSQCV